MQDYSPEIAKKIQREFGQRGWNLYTRDPDKTASETIRQGPVEDLEIQKSYVLLPVADDPRNPEQVMDALEALAQKLNREIPTIRVGYDSHPLTGITLKEDKIKIHGPEGTHVSYLSFLVSLDSVVETR